MKCTTRNRKSYGIDQLERAIFDAKVNGNVRAASRKFGIPLNTVLRGVKGKLIGNKPGPKSTLTPYEETRIKNWVLYMSKAGFAISISDLNKAVTEYKNKIKLERHIPDSFPSKNWSERFLNRHPCIKEKFVTTLSKAGAKVTEEYLRNWFCEVENTLKEENIDMSIFNCPERVLNFNESSFRLVPNEYRASCADNKETSNSEESYAVLFGCTAAGDLTPPSILYPGKQITNEMAENVPLGWSVGVSDEGWQTSKTFYEYVVNELYKWLVERQTVFPVIIFLDGHTRYVNIELAEFCVQHKMHIVSLYPNSSRIVQPLDRHFIGPLKAIWAKVLCQHLQTNHNSRVTNSNFGQLMKTAVDSFTNTKECLKKAFKMSGLCPWNVNEIDFSDLPTNATGLQEPALEVRNTPVPNDCFQLQLKYIEMGLTEDQLTRFILNRDQDYWYGALEELALFNFWKNIKDKSENLMFTEPLTQFQATQQDYAAHNVTGEEEFDGEYKLGIPMVSDVLESRPDSSRDSDFTYISADAKVILKEEYICEDDPV